MKHSCSSHKTHNSAAPQGRRYLCGVFVLCYSCCHMLRTIHHIINVTQPIVAVVNVSIIVVVKMSPRDKYI